MAFTLHNRWTPKTPLGTVILSAVAAGAIFISAIVYNAESKGFESFTASGNSMLPNYYPGQTIVANSNFDTIERHGVYMTSELRYRQYLNEPASDGISMKRVVGVPGDRLTFNTPTGTLTHINGVALSFTPAKDLMRIKATIPSSDLQSSAVYITPAVLHEQSGAQYPVYQFTEKQYQQAKIDERRIIDMHTEFRYLDSLSDQETVTVLLANDEYFLLSDNRIVGLDSRHYGPVKRSEIIMIAKTKPDTKIARIETSKHH